jgi:hypothetical protein
MTTHLGVSSWGQIFADPWWPTSPSSIAYHAAVVFNIDGERYGMRSHRARTEKHRRRVPKDEA